MEFIMVIFKLIMAIIIAIGFIVIISILGAFIFAASASSVVSNATWFFIICTIILLIIFSLAVYGIVM